MWAKSGQRYPSLPQKDRVYCLGTTLASLAPGSSPPQVSYWEYPGILRNLGCKITLSSPAELQASAALSNPAADRPAGRTWSAGAASSVLIPCVGKTCARASVDRDGDICVQSLSASACLSAYPEEVATRPREPLSLPAASACNGSLKACCECTFESQWRICRVQLRGVMVLGTKSLLPLAEQQ